MTDADTTAARLLGALEARRQMPPLTDADPAFDLRRAAEVARCVSARRQAAGAGMVGRKIGFTNRTIWDEYNVHAPIWGPVWTTTLHGPPEPGTAFDLGALVEPRIEPEIVFRLDRAPGPGRDEAALMGCVGAVALGFELVQSLFPGWRFRAPDTVAAFGLHGALVVGPWVEVTEADRSAWHRRLADFRLRLTCDGVLADEGHSANVMGGGPPAALAHLAALLDAEPEAPPLAAGEVVSTGTLTRALPVAPGQRWRAEAPGLGLPPIELTLT